MAYVKYNIHTFKCIDTFVLVHTYTCIVYANNDEYIYGKCLNICEYTIYDNMCMVLNIPMY